MFRALVAPRSFAEIFMDHGYNATPAWTMIGSALSNWNWESGVPDPNQVNSPANLEGKPTTHGRPDRASLCARTLCFLLEGEAAGMDR